MNTEHENEEVKAPEEEHLEELDFEPEDELGDIGAAKAKLKKLKDELAKTKTERQEYLDGWQRSKADSVNMRKESLAQAERMAVRGRESVLEDIIPVLDSFDMAVGSENWTNIDESWRSGMDHIRNQLLDVLSKNGVERFGKVGQMLDHSLHEAVQEMDDVAGEPHSIVRILRHGYRMGDRILRPAQVVIKSSRD